VSLCLYTAVEPECPVEVKRPLTESFNGCDDVNPSSSEAVQTSTSATVHSLSVQSRIPLPLLSGSAEDQYRAQRTEEASTLVWNCDRLKCDEPLRLRLPQLYRQRTRVDSNHSSPVQLTDSSIQTCTISKNNAFSALIAAYESSDTEEQ